MEVMSSPVQAISKYDMETDISKLEAPTFTTIDRSNPASMLSLDWDHQVNLVGKKVLNPMIHSCDKCLKPILIYGRMIPCKHVFCLGCAKAETKTCPRCGDKVVRVEQAGLGNIFLCTIGGSRYGNNGCRRTYLSGRDLQAHIAHRHSDKREKAGDRDKGRDKEKEKDKEDSLARSVSSISKASLASVLAAVNSAASTYNSYTAAGGQLSTAVTASSSSGAFTTQVSQSHGGSGMNISVLNTRPPGNLITVHHQETAGGAAPASGQAGSYGGYSAPAGSYHNYHAPPAASPAVTYPNLSQPPPTYSGYSGYTGTASATAGTAGYQPYQAASAYSSLTAAPPPGPAQSPAAGSAYASAGGQPGSVSGGYAAAGGQAGAGYGANGGYSVAPGGQHWSRPPPATQNSGYYRR